MHVIGKPPQLLFRNLEQDGLKHCTGSGKCDMGAELEPRQVLWNGNVRKMLHQGGRKVDIRDVSHVIECEGARHHANDAVGSMIKLQRLPENVGIAAEVSLPEAVVENNHGEAAVLCIGWLDVAPEKRAHTKKSPGVLCEIGGRNVFGQRATGDLHVCGVEAEHRLNRSGTAQVI